MSLLEWLKRFIKEKIEKAGGETLETLLELKMYQNDQGKKIIEGLSFDVRAGEIFGFLGPNGAGKTTTIRMIVGHMSITAGEIAVCGVSVKKTLKRLHGISERSLKTRSFINFNGLPKPSAIRAHDERRDEKEN